MKNKVEESSGCVYFDLNIECQKPPGTCEVHESIKRGLDQAIESLKSPPWAVSPVHKVKKIRKHEK